MSGFLAAKERCYNMNQRLEHYRRMTAPAAAGVFVAAPEIREGFRAFPPQSSPNLNANIGQAIAAEAAAANSRINTVKNTVKNTPKGNSGTGLKLPESLFGIELNRDNCLIIALVIMMIKEKADIKLIIALIYLLL
jgi:hypothetical protein